MIRIHTEKVLKIILSKETEFQEAKKEFNEKNIKEMVKDSIKKIAKEEVRRNSTYSNIPDEKIEQAFAIIDVHTRLLDNMTTINNYNLTIQVISSLMTLDSTWSESEDRCKELIEDYLKVYVNDEEIAKDQKQNDIQELLRKNIKNYIIYSCLTYFAIYKKDRSLLESYNKNISDCIKVILQIMNAPSINRINNRDNIKPKEIPQEVIDELEKKKDE